MRSLISGRQALIVLGMTIASMLLMDVLLGSLPDLGYTSDFHTEAWPSYQALAGGHIAEFFRLGPPYISSLVLRAPFAMVAVASGGSSRAVYIASSVPCLAAAPVLAIWLSHRQGDAARTRASSAVLVGLFALNPIVWFSLACGHSEEILGACLSIAAVVLAAEGRAPAITGALLGLAVVNKPWALAVVPVVFAVIPAGRLRAAVPAGTIAAVGYAPIVLAHLTASGATGALAGGIGNIFFSPFLGWWLGPSAWTAQYAHELIIVVACFCGGAWWLLRGRQPSSVEERRADGLALLALVLLLRCALDPWNNIYYAVPFIFTVIAWEGDGRWRLAILASALFFVAARPAEMFKIPFDHTSPLNAAVYAVVAVPTLAVLMVRVYGSRIAWARLVTSSRRRLATGRTMPLRGSLGRAA
jgi:hypothetical protein